MAVTRRHAGLGVLGALVCRKAGAMVLPPRRQITCRVVRAGSDIGRALYTFDASADHLRVNVNVDISVRLGFITVFRYTHANTEEWNGDQLLGFDAHTNNNGVHNFATARRVADGVAVTGSKTAPYTAPPSALGTSYWNVRTLVDPLIDSEHGKLLKLTTLPVGTTPAPAASGDSEPAHEYRMTGDLHLNVWYDAAKNLAGLQYYAHDGSVITYEKA